MIYVFNSWLKVIKIIKYNTEIPLNIIIDSVFGLNGNSYVLQLIITNSGYNYYSL